jgi:hypothetical protein
MEQGAQQLEWPALRQWHVTAGQQLGSRLAPRFLALWQLTWCSRASAAAAA